MDEITALQAEVLKALAHPRRLEVMLRLKDGPCEVGALAQELALSQPNLSQQLAVLRATGLVEAERQGREVRYRIADPEVITACRIMRGVLERRLLRLAQLSSSPAEPATPGGAAARPAHH
jgi:ArsR family transcriptional regulator